MYNVRLFGIGTVNPPVQWVYAKKNEKKNEKQAMLMGGH
jgi:hypothetical protein